MKLQLSDANSSLANLQRDSLTISALKNQVKASAEDAGNARHEMTRQMDEFSMERVQMMAKIERLELTIKTTSNNDIKLQQTISELQNELNDKMQEEVRRSQQKDTAPSAQQSHPPPPPRPAHPLTLPPNPHSAKLPVREVHPRE